MGGTLATSVMTIWEQSETGYVARISPDGRWVAFFGGGEIKKVHGDVLKSGKILGGPFAWIGRDGFTFLQASSEGGLIRSGAKLLFETAKGEYEY